MVIYRDLPMKNRNMFTYVPQLIMLVITRLGSPQKHAEHSPQLWLLYIELKHVATLWLFNIAMEHGP